MAGEDTTGSHEVRDSNRVHRGYCSGKEKITAEAQRTQRQRRGKKVRQKKRRQSLKNPHEMDQEKGRKIATEAQSHRGLRGSFVWKTTLGDLEVAVALPLGLGGASDVEHRGRREHRAGFGPAPWWPFGELETLCLCASVAKKRREVLWGFYRDCPLFPSVLLSFGRVAVERKRFRAKRTLSPREHQRRGVTLRLRALASLR